MAASAPGGSALTFTGSISRQAKGRSPSLCINDDGSVVEMHQPTRSSRIHYHVGKMMDNFTVRWSEETDLDDGAHPSVALNSRNVVLGVCETSMTRKIYYRVGKLDPVTETIRWGNSFELGWGRYPKVALNNEGQAVIIYEAALTYGSYYRTGIVSAEGAEGSVVWSQEERKLFSVGINELTLAMNQVGHVVAAGRISGHKIQFLVGELQEEPLTQSQNQSASLSPSESVVSSVKPQAQPSFTITWGPPKEFNLSSSFPSVSINNEQYIVVALQDKSGGGLSYRLGKFDVNDKLITWEHTSRKYDTGINPTIALCNDGRIIEEHEGKEFALQAGHQLYYRVGTLHTKAAATAGVQSSEQEEEAGETKDEHANE